MKFNLRAILPYFEITHARAIYKLACTFFFMFALMQTIQAQDENGAKVCTVKIKVEINDSSGANEQPIRARDVRLFRNGTLIKVWRGDVLKGQKQTTLEATVPIIAGENRFTAYAFNLDNVKSVDSILYVTGSQELKRKGTLYLISVGINSYENPIFNLRYTVADARAFADAARVSQMKVGNYERVEVAPLFDKDATKENLLMAFKILSGTSDESNMGSKSLPPALTKLKAVQPEDAVVVFFAGHGAARESRFYLLLYDIGFTGTREELKTEGLQTILSHSISDLELEKVFEGIDAGQLLLVIDACNSGQALEAQERRRGPMNSQGLAQLAYEKGIYILTAAQSYQAALEAVELGHGYLTYALVEEGLKQGKADDDPQDNILFAREWLDYATARVPAMQEKKMEESRGINFGSDEEPKADAPKRDAQRPRVFYRRETERRSL